VPAGHMKRGKAHIVPLSEAALAVLRRSAALKLAGTNHVFPGVGGKTMSDMTLLKVLRDAGEPYHVHGFRSTFTDWAADKTNFANAVVDAAKAHKTPDATEAAYRRTTHMEKRRALMEVWGGYCSGESTGTVIAFSTKGATA
jgi:integrase